MNVIQPKKVIRKEHTPITPHIMIMVMMVMMMTMMRMSPNTVQMMR